METRGACHMHYLRFWRNGTYKARSWSKTGLSTKDRKEYMRKYRIMNGIKSISAMHKARFGSVREKVLERDNYLCCVCGMTRKEHKKKWKRDLTLDHIDGNGRYSNKPNNNPDNIWTLCLSCHGKRDSLGYLISKGKTVSAETIKSLRLE